MMKLYLLFIIILQIKSYSIPSNIFMMKLGDKTNINLDINKEVKGILINDGKDNEGIDMKYPIIENKNNEEQKKIYNNIEKLKLLRTLESHHYTLENRISRIKSYDYLFDSKKLVDLTSGGLYDDWDNEFN